MSNQKLFPYCLALFSLLFYTSCRKSDSESTIAEKPTSIDKFFNLSASADSRLKAIAQSIRTQEKEKPFLEKFTKKTGWPVWNKAKIIDQNNSSGRGSGTDSGALVYIPFVQDTSIMVNAVLAVRMNESDTAWRMLYASNYEVFGFGATSDTTWNARNVFQFFALFQYDIFGDTKFLIKDQRLFNSPIDSFIITLKDRNGVAINSGTNRAMEWHEVVECGTWQVCGIPAWAARSSRIDDDCWQINICNTYYWDDGLGGTGGTGWTGSSWSSGNGSGGGGVWAGGDPCVNQNNTCTAGWTPINTYVVFNGVTYTPESYPGMNNGFPWLWWENSSLLSPYGGTDFGNWAIAYLSQNPNVPFSVFQSQFMGTSDGKDETYDPSYWDDPNLTFPIQNLPTWSDFSTAYPTNQTAVQVYTLVGGTPKALRDGVLGDSDPTNDHDYDNACALRLSRALNYSGVTIPHIPGSTYAGSDGKYYFLGAKKLNVWMRKTFGTDPATSTTPYNAKNVHITGTEAGAHGANLPTLLSNKKGIYSLVSSDPSWATGHADILYDNATCDLNCHFSDAPISYIDVWILD